MDQMHAQLKEIQEIFATNNENLPPKIQRVPIFLRQKDKFSRYISPMIISFGPIHHATESLKQQGERYKLLSTSRFVEEYGKKIDQDIKPATELLLQKIEDDIEVLKKLYIEDANGSYSDNDLAWLLFVDGCSLLHFMENHESQHPEVLNINLAQLEYMSRDILLLENQLPWRLLHMLSKEKGTDPEYLLRNYFFKGGPNIDVMVLLRGRQPVHLLDAFRSIFLVSRDEPNPDQQHGDEGSLTWKRVTYKNIQDLKRVGIKMRANKRDVWGWTDISFTSKSFGGELRLPYYHISNRWHYLLRNLIAYEMCPDVRSNFECCTFIAFMDSLIDSAEDVKELRLAGVLANSLGSDEELAKFINELGDNLPTKGFLEGRNTLPCCKKLALIKLQMEQHYRNKCKTLLAEAYNTCFKTPWSAVALFAAIAALVLTFTQTCFTMKPTPQPPK